MNLSEIPCQEAHVSGLVIGGKPARCGNPGAKIIFHQHDGRHVYVMCEGCATHNLRNRRAIELVPAEPTQ